MNSVHSNINGINIKYKNIYVERRKLIEKAFVKFKDKKILINLYHIERTINCYKCSNF